MFAKLKQLFAKTETDSLPTLSDHFPHPNLPAGDASQCPFMSKKQQPQP